MQLRVLHRGTRWGRFATASRPLPAALTKCTGIVLPLRVSRTVFRDLDKPARQMDAFHLETAIDRFGTRVSGGSSAVSRKRTPSATVPIVRTANARGCRFMCPSDRPPPESTAFSRSADGFHPEA